MGAHLTSTHLKIPAFCTLCQTIEVSSMAVIFNLHIFLYHWLYSGLEESYASRLELRSLISWRRIFGEASATS